MCVCVRECMCMWVRSFLIACRSTRGITRVCLCVGGGEHGYACLGVCVCACGCRCLHIYVFDSVSGLFFFCIFSFFGILRLVGPWAFSYLFDFVGFCSHSLSPPPPNTQMLIYLSLSLSLTHCASSLPIYTCEYIHTRVNMYVQIHRYQYIRHRYRYIYTYGYTHTRVNINVYIVYDVYVYTCVYVFICMYQYLCMWKYYIIQTYISYTYISCAYPYTHMGWLRLVGSLKL